MVSKEELRKTESEVQVAEALGQIAQAETRVAELHLNQANRAKSDPERLKEYFARSHGAGTSGLERRIERVEQKLDQILKALTPNGR